MQVNTGDGIAQLLLFPYITGKATPVERTVGSGCTEKYVFWQTVVNDLRPKLKLQVNGIVFRNLEEIGGNQDFTEFLELRVAPLKGL